MRRYWIYALLLLAILLFLIYFFSSAIPRLPNTEPQTAPSHKSGPTAGQEPCPRGPDTQEGGDKMDVSVKCSVANCKYYSHLECTAKSIEINCDDTSMLASDSMETCCDTFTPVEDREEILKL